VKSLLRWPRTLASRLALIFFTGLVLAYGLSFSSQFYERYQSARSMMLGNLEQDVSTSVAILDRLPAAERAAWLPRLERRTYRYRLDAGEPGQTLDLENAPMAALSIDKAIGRQYALDFQILPGPTPHFQVHLRMTDGKPLTVDVTPAPVPLSSWLPVVLLIQLAVLLLCTWLAVKTAIRPLTRLAQAVDHLDPNAPGPHLDETGPREVVYAAVAFNAMQARIATYLKERMQLLAAISHDLQTPITRMKLRVEFMDTSAEKDKLWSDLDAMEHLVREGVAYARSVDGSTEASCRVNLDAFLDSLVFDYQDSGQQVDLGAKNGAVIETRPHALRRVLVNLVDNALKFAGAAQLEVCSGAGHTTLIRVLDNGPGIPAEELEEVLKPFYRVETSRNRSTGGTGLGLAIAQQLAQAIGGTLTLSNRDGGGLCAQIELRGPAA
jgi:signal transduction histidine kinase